PSAPDVLPGAGAARQGVCMHRELEEPIAFGGSESNGLSSTPAFPLVELVTDLYHGIEVVDPYRWLEDSESPRTRQWLAEQDKLWRSYLEGTPEREQIRQRIAQLLNVETCEVPRTAGHRQFFRKRAADQEQPCIYMREGDEGEDILLIDPTKRDKFTAVNIVAISKDGEFLACEVRHGGEHSCAIEILDVDRRETLPDKLPRGHRRAFFFASDAKSFFYIQEFLSSPLPIEHALFEHRLGADPTTDRMVYTAGTDPRVRLTVSSPDGQTGYATVQSCDENATRYLTDIYTLQLRGDPRVKPLLNSIEGRFRMRLVDGRFFAITDQGAPNSRIVEIAWNAAGEPSWHEIIPESDARIQKAIFSGGQIFVTYTRKLSTQIRIFDLAGKKIGKVQLPKSCSAHLTPIGRDSNDLFLHIESFRHPPAIYRYRPATGEQTLWQRRPIPFDGAQLGTDHAWCRSKDGTNVHMFLVGQKEALRSNEPPDAPGPLILTAYGGFGRAMLPKFGIFTSYMMERGCIFALANIRGGGEFGVEWHEAGMRRNRQNSFDDFIAAAEWLLSNGYTTPEKLCIFGGCNSGVLVGAALTQRPELFRVAMLMAPVLDMLRYHLHNSARNWAPEYGLPEDPADFVALSKYSPYHHVEDGVAYPAVLMISGDNDMKVNPMHSRKMTARLQAATSSGRPVLLDYSAERGHSANLPLSFRIEALTNRIAFVCKELGVEV
ncbi:MAG TPA: prolyl oligopeptidase family serine peptidase, partial [Candidatus Polarisedimenticolia bacterium]|nr:prolyl oligopeptidase family serine peptidase [Candidatus Polarisedimenticolia bacterium]